MAGERYTTLDEDALLRMVRQAGTPEGAAQNLFARLEALEAFAAQVEAEQTVPAEMEEAETSPPPGASGEGSPG